MDELKLKNENDRACVAVRMNKPELCSRCDRFFCWYNWTEGREQCESMSRLGKETIKRREKIMEADLSNTKEAGFVSIHNAIDGMYRIISKLETLSQDIKGPSALVDPEKTEEGVDLPVSLSGILESGPTRINTTVEECVKRIDEIRSLILS